MDGETGQGSISGVESAANYTVVYPASITGGADITGASNINITLPTVQNYSVNNNKQQLEAPMLAYSDGDSRLTFTNLCSLLKVTVSNTTGSTITMKSIKVSGANLCGTGTISNVTTSPTLTMAGGAGDTLVTLDFSNTETTINTGNTASYYIILPKDETGHKLTININAINNTDNYSIIARSTNTLTVAAGLLYNGPTLEPQSADFLGAGSEGNPYLINHLTDLTKLRTRVNGGTNYSGKYFKVMSDIDCGEWNTTIGASTSNNFCGTFDGNNKTITYSRNTSGSYQGLFRFIQNGATVRNLIVNCTLYNAGMWSGCIASQCYGRIENCRTLGTINSISYYTGGISGILYAPGVITNCYSAVNITEAGSSSFSNIGGIAGGVGSGPTTISYCSASGRLTSNSHVNIGGIVGLDNTSSGNYLTLSNCTFTGSVNGASTYIGMTIGKPSQRTIIENCYYLNTSSIKGIGNETNTGIDKENKTTGKTSSELLSIADAIENAGYTVYAAGIRSGLGL